MRYLCWKQNALNFYICTCVGVNPLCHNKLLNRWYCPLSCVAFEIGSHEWILSGAESQKQHILNAGVFLKSLPQRNSACGRISENLGNEKVISWTFATPIFYSRRTNSILPTDGSNWYVFLFTWAQPCAKILTCNFFLKKNLLRKEISLSSRKPDLFACTPRESGISSIHMSSPRLERASSMAKIICIKKNRPFATRQQILFEALPKKSWIKLFCRKFIMVKTICCSL